jgi:hypothetical protein
MYKIKTTSNTERTESIARPKICNQTNATTVAYNNNDNDDDDNNNNNNNNVRSHKFT